MRDLYTDREIQISLVVHSVENVKQLDVKTRKKNYLKHQIQKINKNKRNQDFRESCLGIFS